MVHRQHDHSQVDIIVTFMLSLRILLGRKSRNQNLVTCIPSSHCFHVDWLHCWWDKQKRSSRIGHSSFVHGDSWNADHGDSFQLGYKYFFLSKDRWCRWHLVGHVSNTMSSPVLHEVGHAVVDSSRYSWIWNRIQERWFKVHRCCCYDHVCCHEMDHWKDRHCEGDEGTRCSVC